MLDIATYATIFHLFLLDHLFLFHPTSLAVKTKLNCWCFLVQNDEMQGQAETGRSATSKALEAPVLLDFDTEISKKHEKIVATKFNQDVEYQERLKEVKRRYLFLLLLIKSI